MWGLIVFLLIIGGVVWISDNLDEFVHNLIQTLIGLPVVVGCIIAGILFLGAFWWLFNTAGTFLFGAW
jgi:hypothetical protein